MGSRYGIDMSSLHCLMALIEVRRIGFVATISLILSVGACKYSFNQRSAENEFSSLLSAVYCPLQIVHG